MEGPIIEDTADPIDDLDEILGDYVNTRNEIIGKEMIVNVGNRSIVENAVDYDMLYETKGVGPIGNFKEFEVDTDNETEDESNTEENDTSGSDSKDLYYHPKHDVVFDDDEHILEDVLVSMNNFNFNPNSKHDLSIVVVEVHEHDLNVIDYDSFGSDLDDGIDFERRTQLRGLRRIGKIGDHVIKTLATNPNIHVRAVQDQMQKQFDVGISKMKAFRSKIIARTKSSLQQELLEGCPFPGQILTSVGVDANNGIYLVAYAIVEAESKRDLYTPLQVCFQVLNTARATTIVEFNKKMAQLKSYNSVAYDWLIKIPAE
ncbi:hypothetical protein Tco_0505695 [Tanacetum coccineum]